MFDFSSSQMWELEAQKCLLEDAYSHLEVGMDHHGHCCVFSYHIGWLWFHLDVVNTFAKFAPHYPRSGEDCSREVCWDLYQPDCALHESSIHYLY